MHYRQFLLPLAHCFRPHLAVDWLPEITLITWRFPRSAAAEFHSIAKLCVFPPHREGGESFRVCTSMVSVTSDCIRCICAIALTC